MSEVLEYSTTGTTHPSVVSGVVGVADTTVIGGIGSGE